MKEPELITYDKETEEYRVYKLIVPYCYIQNLRTLKYWKFKITFWMLRLMWIGK